MWVLTVQQIEPIIILGGAMSEKQAIYTASDLAKKANVSISYVARLCRKGKIEATKLGPVWLINAEVAEQWLVDRSKHQ